LGLIIRYNRAAQLVERLFNRIKQCARRNPIQKSARNYPATVTLAAII
jgi:hypothetical protein